MRKQEKPVMEPTLNADVDCMLALVFDDNKLRQRVAAYVPIYRAKLLGPNPGELTQEVAEYCILSWLQFFGWTWQSNRHQRQSRVDPSLVKMYAGLIDRAGKRLLEGITALMRVRKLTLEEIAELHKIHTQPTHAGDEI